MSGHGRRIGGFLIAAAVTVVSAVTAPAMAEGSVSGQTVQLTEQDAGRKVNLHVGQSCVITLFENATTGYRWAIDTIDPSLLESAGVTPKYGGGAVGSGGHVDWKFVAKAPGTASVGFKLWRQWAGDSSIIRRLGFEFHIVR
jgi:inhibitor of cysteine peptidase